MSFCCRNTYRRRPSGKHRAGQGWHRENLPCGRLQRRTSFGNDAGESSEESGESAGARRPTPRQAEEARRVEPSQAKETPRRQGRTPDTSENNKDSGDMYG
eukprot:scaffold20215_cov43-Prasinocladus_malaysianus.AAC.1